MKKLIAAITLAALQSFAGETKTITLQWDHDGQNALGFRIYSRQATNASFAVIATTGQTNRIAYVTLTNPPPSLELMMTTTNLWLESDPSPSVFLSKPNGASNFKVVSVVTIQIP